MQRAPTSDNRRALWVLPLATFLVLSPLLLHGASCGQDQLFHLQSWLDASAQLRHGHYPTWAFSPAFHAGEPRFLFYPPLSWLLGALLIILTSALHLPAEAAPIAFAFIALTAAGLAFHRLARAFVSPTAALLSATLYLANPYMLYNALERSAYAELLAATWIPLLFLAALRPRPTLRGIAIPLALLWLTNAPAAVMGSYTLAVIATLRVFRPVFIKVRNRRSAAPLLIPNPYSLIPVYLAGTALGLALPAFYLLPAAHQRKFVQVAMAIIPNLRFQDNFLFTATSDAAHNAVNRTASDLALTLLAATVLILSTLFLIRLSNSNTVILSEGAGHPPAPKSKDSEEFHPSPGDRPFSTPNPSPNPSPSPAPTLALLTLLIAFLLVPLSTPIWLHLPELAYLQFPWRLLTLLSTILALSLAFLFDRVAWPLNPKPWPLNPVPWTLTLLLPLALGLLGYHLYAQACDPADRPSTAAALFASGHGVLPTDEYTPIDADNDVLRSNNPAFWLLPANADPNTPAPNTTPTPSQLNPSLSTDDTPIPASQTLSTTAPASFTIHPTQPSILVLNLRTYPNWIVTRTLPGQPVPMTARTLPGQPVPMTARPLPRDDGLIAIPIEAGPSTITITWQRSLDQNLGLTISLIALCLLALTFRKPLSSSLPPS